MYAPTSIEAESQIWPPDFTPTGKRHFGLDNVFGEICDFHVFKFSRPENQIIRE